MHVLRWPIKNQHSFWLVVCFDLFTESPWSSTWRTATKSYKPLASFKTRLTRQPRDQTPSTGLRHPSPNHCLNWLCHRSWKPVITEIRFKQCCVQIAVHFWQTTQIMLGISCITADVAHDDTNKTKMISARTELLTYLGRMHLMFMCVLGCY